MPQSDGDDFKIVGETSYSLTSVRRHIRPKSDPVIFPACKPGMIEELFQEMKTATKKVATKYINKGYKLLSHAELPDWLKDNEFLPHFHRPALPSVSECFKSIVKIHTETGNIWTHLAGQILFVLASINFYFACPNYLPEYIPKLLRICLFWLPSFWSLPFLENRNIIPIISKENWDKSHNDICVFNGMNLIEHVTVGFFLIGANICLLFSWLFHTFSCHSPKALSIFSRLDYAGISTLITASCYPIFYFGFKGKLFLQIIYILTVTIFGILCIIVSSFERFSTPLYRPFRASLFSLLGLFGVVPFIHMGIIYGFEILLEQFAGYYVILMGLTYLAGAALYANRFPEKFFPGYFNIWFQSHQIFHICVIFGLFFTLRIIFILVNGNTLFLE